MTKIAITKRLDVVPEAIDRAKTSFSHQTTGSVPQDLEEVHFREMLDHAVDRFLPQVCEMLGDGMKGKVERRQRPISIATWDRLGKVAEEYNVNRILLIRCVLGLMGEQ